MQAGGCRFDPGRLQIHGGQTPDFGLLSQQIPGRLWRRIRSRLARSLFFVWCYGQGRRLKSANLRILKKNYTRFLDESVRQQYDSPYRQRTRNMVSSRSRRGLVLLKPISGESRRKTASSGGPSALFFDNLAATQVASHKYCNGRFYLPCVRSL